MNDALHQIISDRLFELRRKAQELKRVNKLYMQARMLLFTHQWGGSGHCPDCALPMSGGTHRDDCRILAAINGRDPETDERDPA